MDRRSRRGVCSDLHVPGQGNARYEGQTQARADCIGGFWQGRAALEQGALNLPARNRQQLDAPHAGLLRQLAGDQTVGMREKGVCP